MCHIYLYIERATRLFFFLPLGGYPPQKGSLIDRPAKKSGPSFIGLMAGQATMIHRYQGTQPITCGQAAGRDQSGSSYTRSTGSHRAHRVHSRSQRIQYIHEDSKSPRHRSRGSERGPFVILWLPLGLQCPRPSGKQWPG